MRKIRCCRNLQKCANFYYLSMCNGTFIDFTGHIFLNLQYIYTATKLKYNTVSIIHRK
jgi:hypothetical protein